MDQTALHCELNNIKQWAALYTRPTPPATSEDMFSDDLAALKMRLQSMEASLNYLNAFQGQRDAQNSRSTAAQSVCNLPSLPSALPSGPLFWQLFTSLRTDVRGLESRVATVEENLSHLKDRVDGLGPNQFAPAGSNASTPWTSDQSTASVRHQDAELPCDYQQYSPVWYPRCAPQRGSNFPATMQYVAGLEATSRAETATGATFRDREIAQLEDILGRVQHDLQESEELVSHKNSQIGLLNYQQESCHDEITQLQQTVRAYNNIFAMNRRGFKSQQAECHEHNIQLLVAKRQIQELQDILANAGSAHQADVDEALADKEIELSRLREFADRKDDVVRQQGDIIARGATIIQERDETIERLSRELKIAVDGRRNEGRPISLDRAKFGPAGQTSLRRNESLKLLEKLALVEDRHRTPSSKPQKPRYRLPLDDFESTCETSPALLQRLSRSLYDDGAGHQNTASKYQHVHPEQARRSLQAYVEGDDNREKCGDAA